ncbi:MAG: hypothetical protein ACRDFS_13650 [Chloroflexota bacterium]
MLDLALSVALGDGLALIVGRSQQWATFGPRPGLRYGPVCLAGGCTRFKTKLLQTCRNLL